MPFVVGANPRVIDSVAIVGCSPEAVPILIGAGRSQAGRRQIIRSVVERHGPVRRRHRGFRKRMEVAGGVSSCSGLDA